MSGERDLVGPGLKHTGLRVRVSTRTGDVCMSRVRLTIVMTVLLALSAGAAPRGWVSYHYSGQSWVNQIAQQGDTLWMAVGGGMTRLIRTTGQRSYYNMANSGMPGENLTGVVIDSLGRKWFATNAGVTIYDGRIWTTFDTSNSSLPKNDIKCIAIDSSGGVWVGFWYRGNQGSSGMARYDGRTWAVYDSANTPMARDGLITSIAVDTSGVVWVGAYRAGLLRFDGSQWQRFDDSNSPVALNVVCVAVDRRNRVYVNSSSLKVAVRSGATWDSIPCTARAEAMAVDGNGYLWIATGSGLQRWNGVSLSTYTSASTSGGLPDDYLQSVFVDDRNERWVGCSKGWVARYNGATWSRYLAVNSQLPTAYVNCVFVDRANVTWFGTDRGAVALRNDSSWTVYTRANSGIGSDTVNCIAGDGVRTWFGAPNGLSRYSSGFWSTYDSTRCPALGSNVSSVCMDRGGRLWVATWNRGVAVFDDVRWTVYNDTNSDLPSRDVVSIASDSVGTMWFVTGNGVASFDGLVWKVYNSYNSPMKRDYSCRSVHVDALGRVWLGAWGNVFLVDGSQWSVFDSTDGIPPNEPMMCGVSSGQTTWFGLQMCGALASATDTWVGYDGPVSGSWARAFCGTGARVSSGLAGWRVSGMAADATGNVWFATDNGASVYLCGEPPTGARGSARSVPVASRSALSVSNVRGAVRIAFGAIGTRGVATIHDPFGRRVCALTLRDGTAVWDGRIEGRAASAGTYVVRVRASDAVAERQVLLMW